MTTQDNNPQYEGRPVILVHLTVNATTNIAWCAPIEYKISTDTSLYPNIPRVICPACLKASMTL